MLSGSSDHINIYSEKENSIVQFQIYWNQTDYFYLRFSYSGNKITFGYHTTAGDYTYWTI